MKRALLAAALVAAPMAAAASPPVDAFIKTCGAAGDDFAAVSAALAGPEWKPAEVAAPDMKGIIVSQSLARVGVIGPTKVTVQAWQGASKDQVRISDCTFRLGARPFAGAADEVRAWAGVAPQDSSATKAGYHFTIDAIGARQRVGEGDAKAAVAAGGLFFLTVTANGLDTIIDLLKIKA
jgi:hypothetical protein